MILSFLYCSSSLFPSCFNCDDFTAIADISFSLDEGLFLMGRITMTFLCLLGFQLSI